MKRALLITPSLIPHDAVSNDVRLQHKVLQELLPTYIYCDIYIEDGYSTNFLVGKEELLTFLKDPESIVVYHHSIYWQDFPLLFNVRAKLYIKYHNITPPSFFLSYSQAYYDATSKGIRQTQMLQKLSAIFMADSAFNAYDIPQAFVVPPFTILDDFDRTVDLDFAKEVLGHRPNILFVGRFAPNKGHAHLLKVLYFLKKLSIDPKLHIAGAIDPQLQRYYDRIENLIDYYGLNKNVTIYDKLPFTKLLTLYKSCDLFLLLSEHEGFCVPVLEAQRCSLPIVAVSNGAVAETAGEGARIVDRYDYFAIAKGIVDILENREEALSLVKKGRVNIQRFRFEIVKKKFLNVIFGQLGQDDKGNCFF